MSSDRREEIQREIALQRAAVARKEGACPICQKSDRMIESLKPGEMTCKRCTESFPKVIPVMKKTVRALPRSLRKAYRSKNQAHVKSEIDKAMSMGFSKAEILSDFKNWQKHMEFVE